MQRWLRFDYENFRQETSWKRTSCRWQLELLLLLFSQLWVYIIYMNILAYPVLAKLSLSPVAVEIYANTLTNSTHSRGRRLFCLLPAVCCLLPLLAFFCLPSGDKVAPLNEIHAILCSALALPVKWNVSCQSHCFCRAPLDLCIRRRRRPRSAPPATAHHRRHCWSSTFVR